MNRIGTYNGEVHHILKVSKTLDLVQGNHLKVSFVEHGTIELKYEYIGGITKRKKDGHSMQKEKACKIPVAGKRDSAKSIKVTMDVPQSVSI